MAQENPNFVDTLSQSQRPRAEMPASPFGVSLPPGIRSAQGPGKVPGALETDLEFQIGRFEIPGDDVAYKAVKDRGLRGEIALGLRETTFTPDGTFIIIQEWMEPRQGVLPAARQGGAPDVEPQAAPRRAP